MAKEERPRNNSVLLAMRKEIRRLLGNRRMRGWRRFGRRGGRHVMTRGRRRFGSCGGRGRSRTSGIW